MDHASYAAASAAIRRQLLAYAETVWVNASLDDAGLARVIDLMVPRVQAAQLQVADLTAVYFAEVAGTPVAPLALDALSARGVPPEVVYSRPVITARSALSKGQSVQKALDAGGRRLQNLAGTDVQMAKVRQSRESLRDAPDVKFYRRVLTGSENCAMCMIAATQRYRKADLLPIHPGCDCDVDVIPSGMDLDLVIDPATLEATHQQVVAFGEVEDRGGRAPDYRKLIVTHEHGEVGPVLGWHGQKFTSKADLN